MDTQKGLARSILACHPCPHHVWLLIAGCSKRCNPAPSHTDDWDEGISASLESSKTRRHQRIGSR